MECSLLAPGNSSLEGGREPVWLIGNNITESIEMLLVVMFNICKLSKGLSSTFSHLNLIARLERLNNLPQITQPVSDKVRTRVFRL